MCEFAKALQKPFPAEDIEWRVQRATRTQSGDKAMVLAYVTNRAIMERLDQVFGVAGWKNDYEEWREKGVKCNISCKVDGEWVTKSDGADTTDIEATKGGFSASMKRAAVQWGIGRYLYNLTENRVDVKPRGQHFINSKIKVQGKDEWIKGYWDTPILPSWALPEGYEQLVPLEETDPVIADDLDGLTPPPDNEDIAAIEQSSNERYPQSVPNKQNTPAQTNKPQSGNGMSRVLNLRTELKLDWKSLNAIASSALGREVKYPLKDNVHSEEEWTIIESVLLEAKAS